MGQLRVKQVGQFALKYLGHYLLKQVGQLTVKGVGQYGLIYSIADHFIDEALYIRIMKFFQDREEGDQLKKAGIGKSGEFKLDSSVRGDLIYWLDHDKDQQLLPFFELMDELIDAFRKYCFLSLSGSEFHIAKYPAGSYYKRHLDQFNNRSIRMITVLLYLNENWKKGDGGELRIFGKGEDILVEPIARRLLLFKSDKIEHEVLTTEVPRYCLTGWLLRKQVSIAVLDV